MSIANLYDSDNNFVPNGASFIFQNDVDSADAFVVKNNNGDELLKVDSVAGTVTIDNLNYGNISYDSFKVQPLTDGDDILLVAKSDDTPVLNVNTTTSTTSMVNANINLTYGQAEPFVIRTIDNVTNPNKPEEMKILTVSTNTAFNSIILDASVFPLNDGDITLGDTDKRFSTVYASSVESNRVTCSNIRCSGSVNINLPYGTPANTPAFTILTTDNTNPNKPNPISLLDIVSDKANYYIEPFCHIIPYTNNQLDIGKSGTAFQNLWVTNINGSPAITQEDIQQLLNEINGLRNEVETLKNELTTIKNNVI